MHFHSLDYLTFLVLALSLYWLLAAHGLLRLAFVFAASCAFYMAWNPTYIALILTSTVLDYTVGLRIAAAAEKDEQRAKRAWLLLSLLGNLGLLGVFKYYNFFADATAQTLALVGIEVAPARLDVLLPVGISFYTFQTLSYTIDIYRGRLAPTRSFLRFACFVTFFPQLVAGPIVRASELLPQLEQRPRLQAGTVSSALFLIAVGMIKKVAFADYLAVNLNDRVFDDPSAFTGAEVMLALYGYTMQIYCDFSGYTDVARGSAMLFGLQLPENFDRPYQATSPAEFWRRWHMTLSTWLRDYLYFPLGGSRAAPLRAYMNLGLTMFLIGLWHGADWTFVIYGLLQACAMLVHRYAYRRAGRSADQADPLWLHALKIAGTLHFAVLSRVFFRGSSVDNALEVSAQLLQGGVSIGHVPGQVLAVLAVGYLAHYTPRHWFEEIRRRFVALPAPAQGACLAVVGACLMLVVSQDVVPYIYFQF
ncbi:MAG: MBOAT family protein [Myxococcales bacterium]|nr:MBOAT family protein [Myxococcales bacterium]